MVIHSPGGFVLKKIELKTSDNPITLGNIQLGQRQSPWSAAPQHITFYHQHDQWSVRNISRYKKVDIQTNIHHTRFIKRWLLNEGDTIEINKTKVKVLQANSEGLILKEQGVNRKILWKKGQLFPENEFVYKDNRSKEWRFRRWFFWKCIHPLGIEPKKEVFLFYLGGSVNCIDRWRLPGVQAKSAKILWYDNKYWLAPGKTIVQMARSGQRPKRFNQISFPLTGEFGIAKRMIIGRTHYDIKYLKDGNIELSPSQGQDILKSIKKQNFENIHLTYAHISRIGEGNALYKWLLDRIDLMILWIIACILTIWLLRNKYIYAQNRGQYYPVIRTFFVSIFSVLFLTSFLFLWRDKEYIDFSHLLFLTGFSTFMATICFVESNSIKPVYKWTWCIIILLSGSGLLILCQLAIGAENLKLMIFVRKQVVLMTCFPWFILFAALAPKYLINHIFSRSISGYVLMFIVMSLLLGQRIWGNEYGFSGIQPAEASKLLLVIMAGFIGTNIRELRDYNPQHYSEQPFRNLLDLVKIFFIVGLGIVYVLVSINDISPVIILLIFLLAWFWKISPHPWKPTLATWVNRSFVICISGIGLSLALWAWFFPEQIPDFSQKDRLLVWSNPLVHPHSGGQIIQALQLGVQGGWTGNGQWYGLNNDIMSLPAVQNDFIASFILYKFGGLTAILIITIQFIFILFLFTISHRMMNNAINAGNFQYRRSCFAIHLMIFGFAWIHILHWMIAWGNALGVLPVMGQPMTWFSAANSNILFFGLPALMITMISPEQS